MPYNAYTHPVIRGDMGMTDKILTLHNGTRPLSALSSPKEAIRQFTPNWFAATMGTGILSLSLA